MNNNFKKYIVLSFIIGAILSGGIVYFLQVKNSDNGNNAKHNHDQSSDQQQTWTCSMHPQIKMNKPGSCPICGMELIPVSKGNNASADSSNSGLFLSENIIIQNNIRVSEIGNFTTHKIIKLNGEVKINQDQITAVSAHYDGRIESLNIHYAGEEIKKGQLLYKIYSPELLKAQQEFVQAVLIKSENPALYEAAKNKLLIWKLAPHQVNEIEQSKMVMEYIPIYANKSGLITEIKIKEGEYLKKGQTLFDLSDLSELWIEFDVYQETLSELKIGQEIELNIAAKGYENSKGKITYIDPLVNKTKRTGKVRLTIKNNGNLYPEMFVEGKVNVKQSTNDVLMIPKSAVLWTGVESVAYLELDTNTFKMVEITLGSEYDDYYEVVSGLKKKDRIVVNGTFVVDAATQIQGKASMMNKEN